VTDPHNPPAPACPVWCDAHPHGADWDVDPGAVTKTCTRRVVAAADTDGQPVVISLERFAELVCGAVSVGAAVVRIEAHGSLVLDCARNVARVVMSMVDRAA
jgi:hypothetical protein